MLQAAATLGACPPTRHEITEKYLPAIYKATKSTAIRAIKEAGMFGLASDGWKKRVAFSGDPLINFQVLLPSSGSFFWKVVNTSGPVKDASYIKQLTNDLLMEVQDETGSACTGVVMDSAAANRSALKQLLEVHPKLLALACISHAMSVLIKDLAKSLHWVEQAYKDGVLVSNAVSTETVKGLRREAQLNQSDRKVRVILTHCETRFGSRHLVLRVVMETQHALRGMCATAQFISLMSKPNSELAKSLYGVVTAIAATSLFAEGPVLLELVDPILTAIHKLEGDQPLLSLVLPMIKSMEKHAAAFSEKYPEWSTGSRQKHGKQPESTSVADIFYKRLRQFVYKPCHAAAFVLDPLFFALEDGKWKLPYNSLGESERSDVDECVKRIGGEDAENELFDLVVMNLPCSQLLNKLYASCAAQEVQEDGKVVIAAVVKFFEWPSART